MKAIYSHCRFVEECETEQQAQDFQEMWETAIEELSQVLPVYVRSPATYYKDRAFDNGPDKWIASVRFTIGSTRYEQAGKIKTGRLSPDFNCEDVGISGFDLAFPKGPA